MTHETHVEHELNNELDTLCFYWSGASCRFLLRLVFVLPVEEKRGESVNDEIKQTEYLDQRESKVEIETRNRANQIFCLSLSQTYAGCDVGIGEVANRRGPDCQLDDKCRKIENGGNDVITVFLYANQRSATGSRITQRLIS